MSVPASTARTGISDTTEVTGRRGKPRLEEEDPHRAQVLEYHEGADALRVLRKEPSDPSHACDDAKQATRYHARPKE